MHYSLAEARLRSFAEQHGVPVVETMAGKSTLVADHPLYAGPIGVTGAPQTERAGRARRRRAGRRHAPAGLHDRLVDGVRQRGAAHRRPQRRALRRRQAPQPAARRRRPRGARGAGLGARRLVGAAGLARGGPPPGLRLPRARRAPRWRRAREPASRRTRRSSPRSTREASADDYAVSAAGGFPGELNVNWLSRGRRDVRLRVRLLVHGLRARGCLGSEDGALARRGVRVRRRRLVPDAQLRAAELGHLRPQADRTALRQRRLRRDRAPAGRAGRAVVQQHVLGHRPQPGGGRLGRARTRSRL